MLTDDEFKQLHFCQLLMSESRDKETMTTKVTLLTDTIVTLLADGKTNGIKLIPLVAKVCKKETKEIKGSIYTIKGSIISTENAPGSSNNDKGYYTDDESQQKKRLKHNLSKLLCE